MFSKNRVEAISDGVIAIVITLMILNIKTPQINGSDTWILLSIQVVSYAISFLVIAVVWVNHHHLISSSPNITAKICWANFLLLFSLSLIPLPTQSIGEDFLNPEYHSFYGLTLAFTSVSYSLLHQLIRNELRKAKSIQDDSTNFKNWLSSIVYFAASLVCFVSIYISAFVFILIPALYFFPKQVKFKIHEN